MHWDTSCGCIVASPCSHTGLATVMHQCCGSLLLAAKGFMQFTDAPWMHWGCTLVALCDTSLIVHLLTSLDALRLPADILRCTGEYTLVVVSKYVICIVASHSVYILDLQLYSINVVETCL